MLAPPALEPHAEQHYQLDYVTRGVLAPGYVGATDLLTRATKSSQFATDTCIRREGIDPNTGTRDLEELAFEVVNEQSLSDITGRAQKLTARGVRRVMAIFVKLGEVCEWSRALYAKQEPTILEIEARARAQVARKAIEALCEVLEIPIGSKRRALLQGLDAARLEALVDRIRSKRRWPSSLAMVVSISP